MQDITFFNWANQPWAGKAETGWQIPGMAFSASTHVVLGDTIQRPKRIVFQNCVGQRGADVCGIGLQLYAYSGAESVKSSDPQNLDSFVSLAETVVKCDSGKVRHSWRELTQTEIDALMAITFKYGLVFGVRCRSLDGASPLWYSSKLLVLA